MSNTCLACGHANSKPLFNPGPQPLAALNLPTTKEDSQNAVRLPMNFHSCRICGHVWNVDFEYAKVPYSGDSNLMYNRGTGWMAHMQLLLDRIIENKSMWTGKSIIDIGCGDGMFLESLRVREPEADCIGFEPGIEGSLVSAFKCIRDYFIPERDLKKYRPALLTCRHVLEHLENPREFIAEIAYWCSRYDLNTVFLAEVPCFDKAMKLGRVSDFLYEHVSNYTLNSLHTLFSTSGFRLLEMSKMYDDEVVAGFFQPHNMALMQNHLAYSVFSKEAEASLRDVFGYPAQDNLVLWGGTGKSAAFINMFGFNECDTVVDSDFNKWGKYVPGTGQLIEAPDRLTEGPYTILVTTPWRIKDIVSEIKLREIPYTKILYLSEGRLNEYTDL